MAKIFKLQLDAETKRLFKRLGDKNLIRLKNAFNEIGEKFLGELYGFLNTNKGNKRFWQDLAESTKRAKERSSLYGKPYPSLFRFGDMSDSFGVKGHPDNVWKITNKQASFGSENAVAKFHQKGNPKLPKREIINEQYVKARSRYQKWDAILISEINTLLKKAGFGGNATSAGSINL